MFTTSRSSNQGPGSLHTDHSQTTRQLEPIQSDVWCAMQNKSTGGSFEVLAKFKEFEALVTTQTRLNIAQLGSDNGGAYVGRDFEQYLSGGGIGRQLTVRYTPEQESVAERYNRTIVESG